MTAYKLLNFSVAFGWLSSSGDANLRRYLSRADILPHSLSEMKSRSYTELKEEKQSPVFELLDQVRNNIKERQQKIDPPDLTDSTFLDFLVIWGIKFLPWLPLFRLS